ncbi:MAG: c-type cytochrome domain-containing protein [Pirellulales bacterium]
MSSRFYSWLLSGAFAGMIISLSGCGGGDTSVASAPTATTTPPPAATSTPAESSTPAKEQSSYANEQKSTNSGGSNGGSSGGSSGGVGNERATTALMGEPESGGGDGYTQPGSGGPSSGPPGMAGAPGFSSGSSGGSSGGNSGGMPGSGAGMGGGSTRGPRGGGGMGMSGGPEMGMNSGGGGFGSSGEMLNEGGGSFGGGSFGGGADTTQLVTFVRENCINCHSAGNPKGGVSLDQVGGDLKANARLWSEVAEALEGGSMPPRNARQPDATQKASVIRLIRQLLDGQGGEGPVEKSFMDRAEMAFRKGDHEKAMSLFYAQLITADAKEVSDLANHFKLYKPTVPEAEKDKLAPANETAVAVKPKLVTGLKLAVGVVLKADKGVTDVKPVGVRQLGGPGGGGGMSEGAGGGPGPLGMGGGGRSGGGMGGGNLGSSKMEAFEDLTGDIGSQIVSSYDSRRASGKYGTLFSSLNEETGPSFGPMGAGGFEQSSDMGDAGGLAAASGMGGAPAAGPGRGGRGGGMGMAGGMGPGAGMGGMGMGGASRPSKTMPGKRLANGLLYIGKAENQVATCLRKLWRLALMA